MSTRPKNPAAAALHDLHGMPLLNALWHLERAAFHLHHTTKGGYTEFRHPDGSTIWIRPHGEVIRLGPKTRGKRYRQRYDQHGQVVTTHATGEIIRV